MIQLGSFFVCEHNVVFVLLRPSQIELGMSNVEIAAQNQIFVLVGLQEVEYFGIATQFVIEILLRSSAMREIKVYELKFRKI